jgi:hypothetical protein
LLTVADWLVPPETRDQRRGADGRQDGDGHAWVVSMPSAESAATKTASKLPAVSGVTEVPTCGEVPLDVGEGRTAGLESAIR